MNNVIFSHKSDEWRTPQDFFNNLNKKYKFTVDLAATHENALCKKYFTISHPCDNKTAKRLKNEIIFCNPPYSDILHFVELCDYLSNNNFIVLLIPSRTDTRYFHDYIYKHKGVKIEFIRGRLHFSGGGCCSLSFNARYMEKQSSRKEDQKI